MLCTNGIAELLSTKEPAPSVVSVGVFDGVHRGHLAILRANLARARALDARPTVVTFRGHPKALLLGHAPQTLTSLEHRLELFAKAGIEHAVVLDFDENLRAMDARVFTEDVLIGGLNARAFVLGFDSKFGRDRGGTPEALAAAGYDVEVIEAVRLGGRAVSSTAIREAVTLGDLEGAERMLGRPVTLQGQVVHGAARGRALGFPTANLDLDHELMPPMGVWVTRLCLLESGQRLPSVTNIGFRPTVVGSEAEATIEVHALDFQGDLYDQRVAVEFVQWIRGEAKFASLDALKAAIAADVEQARKVFIQ